MTWLALSRSNCPCGMSPTPPPTPPHPTPPPQVNSREATVVAPPRAPRHPLLGVPRGVQQVDMFLVFAWGGHFGSLLGPCDPRVQGHPVVRLKNWGERVNPMRIHGDGVPMGRANGRSLGCLEHEQPDGPERPQLGHMVDFFAIINSINI